MPLQAIFSDNSDDEGEDSNVIKEDNQEKKAEVANSALSRLIAGDFLESLGKELGLEVPPDMPYPAPKSRNPGPQNETSNENARNDIPNIRSNGEVSLNQHAQDDAVGFSEREPTYGNMLESGSSKAKETNTGEKDDGRKIKTPSARHHDYSSSSSSEEERSRRHAKRHRRRKHDSGSDSSNDDDYDRDSYRSRSKGRNKGSSREKSSSRKHSKHHDRRKRDSPSRSSRHRKEKDHADARREKKQRE